jgi:fructuronate reductase
MHVNDAVADPASAGYLRLRWTRESIPTLTPPPGMALHAYADDLMSRFHSPAIRHQTWQIAMDGSQKLPQRLLATLQDRLDAGGDASALLLAVAAWMRYVGGVDEAGQAIDVRDPLAGVMQDKARQDAPVAALLSLSEVFDPDLARRIEVPLTHAYDTLVTHGARVAAQRITQ